MGGFVTGRRWLVLYDAADQEVRGGGVEEGK